MKPFKTHGCLSEHMRQNEKTNKHINVKQKEENTKAFKWN